MKPHNPCPQIERMAAQDHVGESPLDAGGILLGFLTDLGLKLNIDRSRKQMHVRRGAQLRIVQPEIMQRRRD